MSGGPQEGRRRTVLVLAAIAAIVAFAGALVAIGPLGLGDRGVSAAVQPIPTSTLAQVVTPTTAPPPPPVPASTTIVEVTGAVAYYSAPGGPEAGTVPVGSWWGDTKHLPVIATAPGWLQVRLPQRPNGLTGWIPSAGVALSTTTYGILVDRGTYRVGLYESGRLIGDFPAGVGTPNDPTPLGDYYVMDFYQSPGPGYGPYVVGTNAHSETIVSWQGSGDAFTGLHGPVGADAAIGTEGAAISHGCVRLHLDDLAQLSVVPPGTPVVVVEGLVA